jgi:hypothetical protein
MANAFLTANAIADQAMATLYESTFLGELVHTDYGAELANKKLGDTINIRKPATFTAQKFNRANGIQLQDATESSVHVTLDTIPDVSFAVTDEDMTLKMDNFDERLLTPACEAIVQYVDLAILALRSGVSQVAGTHTDAVALKQTWDQPEVLIEAKRLLDLQKVPLRDRYAVVGPTMASRWLNTELLKQADKSGSTEALREGSIGKNLFGFDTFQTGNVGQPAGSPAIGQPTTEIGLAFHKSALALASAPLELPRAGSGVDAAVRNFKGLSLRVMYGYDQKYKQQVVSVDFLFGVKLLDANRAVLLKGANRAA